MKNYLYWCNECPWEEPMDEHKYDFCPDCGHINISRRTNSLYKQDFKVEIGKRSGSIGLYEKNNSNTKINNSKKP